MQQRAGGWSQDANPRFLFLRSQVMSRRNWITSYCNGPDRPSRYEQPEKRWLELQDSLSRWGQGLSIERLQQLGEIARADINE